MKDKFTNYIDVLGRVTLYNKKLSNPLKQRWDSENQLLWSGEATALLSITNQSFDYINYKKILDLHTVPNHSGLYCRQPASYLGDNTISKDEYLGILLMCMCNGNTDIPQIILKRAKEYDWCLLDTHPNLKPIKSFLKRPIHYLKLMYKKQSDEVIYGLTQLRQPSERLFYKLAAKEEASLIDYIWFYMASMFNSDLPKDKVSSRIMTFFKYQILSRFNEKHKVLETIFRTIYVNKLKQDYGDKYLIEIFKIYYTDPNHPFHELARKFHDN